jgi:hypothetical protein
MDASTDVQSTRGKRNRKFRSKKKLVKLSQKKPSALLLFIFAAFAMEPIQQCFAQIDEELSREGDSVDIEKIRGMLADYLKNNDDWKQYVHFNPIKYARNLVACSKNAELIVLCWMPHQASPIHNHAVRVFFFSFYFPLFQFRVSFGYFRFYQHSNLRKLILSDRDNIVGLLFWRVPSRKPIITIRTHTNAKAKVLSKFQRKALTSEEMFLTLTMKSRCMCWSQ